MAIPLPTIGYGPDGSIAEIVLFGFSPNPSPLTPTGTFSLLPTMGYGLFGSVQNVVLFGFGPLGGIPETDIPRIEFVVTTRDS